MYKAHFYIKIFENVSNTKSGLVVHSFIIPALRKPRQELFKSTRPASAAV